MSQLSGFPITRKWPARHPERLQLYSLPTPNGIKVSILLEELGLAYEPHLVSFEQNDQLSPAFLSRWQAAGPVRIGRHPAVPGRKDGQIHSRGRGSAL